MAASTLPAQVGCARGLSTAALVVGHSCATMPIPPYKPSGLLPPYIGTPLVPNGTAPYFATCTEVVQRFATTPERASIIKGYFDWRANLMAVGMTGFQWLNGSYCEDIEKIETRAPKDIDVVSFTYRPGTVQSPAKWKMFFASHKHLFDPETVKKNHLCHAFSVDLNAPSAALVRHTAYWFGLFSHRRVTEEWKGMVAVDLPGDDAAALALLNKMTAKP